MRNSIFLSGWEYNRLLTDSPFSTPASGLPAQILWDGAAQFWLFEKVFCTKQSLDGDKAAYNDLGWTTGFIFDDLRIRGFMEPIEWSNLVSEDTQLKADIETAWSELRKEFDEKKLLALLEGGRDDILEKIKLDLLSPILRKLGCVQNISPNSIRHWIGGNHLSANVSANVVESGVRSLVEPVVRERTLLRAGFTLCQRPGTGVPGGAMQKQQQIEQQVQRPMIPHLLAGILPQNEYHEALQNTASVYEPVNVQLLNDYKKNIERLERLRDVAKAELWTDLHGEWLPRLEDDPAFLPKFKTLVSDAVARAKFDPYLEWVTDIAILTTSLAVGAGAAIAASDVGLGGIESGAIAATTGGIIKRLLDGGHKLVRDETESLTLFYQKARKMLRSHREVSKR